MHGFRKGSEFQPGHLPLMHCTAENALLHKIWRSIREPFLLPCSICTHSGHTFVGPAAGGKRCLREICAANSWEVYDVSQAGCVLCGSMHVCMDGVCDVEKNEQGHDICIITGLCVKMLNFSSEEFVDTVCMGNASGLDFMHDSFDEGGSFHLEGLEETHPEAAKPGLNKSDDGVEDSSKKARVNNHSEAGAMQCSGRRTAAGGVSVRCSVNKKNRYRSWVYHRVMQPKLAASHGHHFLVVDARHQRAAHQNHALERDDSMCQHQWSVLGRSAAGATQRHESPSASSNHVLHRHPFSTAPTAASLFCVAQQQQLHHQASPMKSDRIHNLIQIYVSEVLCSSKWEKSMQMEVGFFVVCPPGLLANKHLECRNRRCASRRGHCS
jgi:hypothetical protein